MRVLYSVTCLFNRRKGGAIMGTIEPVDKHTQSKRFTAITIKDQETSIIEDTYLLAALVTFDPTIKYSPLQDPSGKVSFEVHGKIADKMGQLYAGDSASLKTYISNLKSLRSAIFALRSTHQRRNNF
jgi:hypothetical protein